MKGDRQPTRARQDCAGVALVVVMWVVLVLSLLISGFAFTMHVETRVASYARKRQHAEALARSGVELARRELILDVMTATNSTYDARNQPWATNEWYVNHALGDGVLNVVVTDEESKIPVNRASPEQLRRLMILMEVDEGEIDIIVDSVVDWMDENDLHQLNGAEDEYYLSLEPPYRAKNAALDRIEELLMVRGVTPELFYGLPATAEEEAVPGLVEFLTATSAGRINVNTAAPLVLQALLGLDDLQLEAVLNRRDGGDGEWGTEDDQPFQSLGEFFPVVAGLTQEVQNQLQSVLTVNSEYFTVRATGDVGHVKRTIVAVLHRHGAQVTIVGWRETAGESG